MKEKLTNICQTYLNKKMLVLTILGFSSGFPFLLVFNTLSLWLKDVHWSYTAIGAFSLVKIPYAFKFLWSPVIDGAKVPFLWRLGRRRSWGILTEICLFLAIFLMSRWTPETNAFYLIVTALMVSFFSATLDIVLDAFRVELFGHDPDAQGAGAAIFVLGYRLGILFSGAGALALASFISWNNVYVIMSFATIAGILTLLTTSEPTPFSYQDNQNQNFKSFLFERVFQPLKDLTQKKDWKLILFLIFIYRLSDAYIGPMAYPFYDDMGFSKLEIAYVIKIYGMAATILGGLYGGLFLKKYGLFQGLYLLVFGQGLTTAFYALQAIAGHHLPMLILTISLENFVSGMATAALVAYMSSLCNTRYTATQYALLSSLLSLARDFFAATSGFVLELTSWPVFFLTAALMCLPSAFIIRRLQREDKKSFYAEK